MGTAVFLSWLLTLAAAIAAAIFFLLWRKQILVKSTAQTQRHNALSRDWAALALENFNEVAWLYDIESKSVVFVSPSVHEQRGWTVDDIITAQEPDNVKLLLGIESVQQLLNNLDHGAPKQRILTAESIVTLKDGGTQPVETEYKLINAGNGSPTLIFGVSRDITERLHFEKSLRDAEQSVRLALECSGDKIWDANLQLWEVTHVEGLEELLGYGAAELEGDLESYTSLIHSEDIEKLQTELERHTNGETPRFQCEFRVRAKDGSWRWLLARGMIWSRSEDGQPLRMIGTHTDITSRKVAEVAMSRANIKLHSQIDEIRTLQTQLAEQAVRDPLTRLYNRRYLDETLDREVSRARREGHPLAIVMLDVDHFKNLNDSYGHQAGDEVLKALADLLRENTRTEDVPCRWGGEEFLILLPSMPLEKAQERAEYWRSQLEKHVFVFGNFSISVTASFGVSAYPSHGKTPDELTRNADMALYSAKHNGRNRVEIYEEKSIVFVTGNPQVAS